MKTVVRKILGERTYARLSIAKQRLIRFLFECFGNGKYSKMGLNGLSDRLNQYLNFRNGVFIEVGANNGVFQSNTYYLEKILGWTGFLIEAIPPLCEACKKNRKRSKVFNCALVRTDQEGQAISINYDTSSNGLMSKIGDDHAASKNIVSVLGRTLTSILKEGQAGKIDFFSLDVEGFELEVLHGLDLERYRPTYILVETEQLESVDEILSHYYTRIDQLSFHDYLYKVKPT